MMNFIALFICAVTAILEGFRGDFGGTIILSFLALINLIYTIKWAKKFFKNKIYQRKQRIYV